MKNKFLRRMMVLSASVLTLFSSVITVNATEVVLTNSASEITTDSSGNLFFAGEKVDLGQQNMRQIGNELFAAGLTVDCDGAQVDGSVFAAGQKVTLNDAVLGGTAFLAGQTVEVAAEADNNMFVVGQQVDFVEHSKAKALYTAGAIVNVRGEYNYVTASADTLYFDAVVDGDVVLEADNIHIGPNAKVTGTLKANYAKSYEANDKASVENAQVTKVEKQQESKKTPGKIILLSFIRRVRSAIKYLFANTVVALLMAFFFRRNLKEAADACKAKPGSYLGFGALTLFCAPIAFVILLITIVGIKASVTCMVFYGLALSLQGVFSFASMGRELFFGRMKKRMNPVLEIIIAVLPYAILCQIPVLAPLTNLACGLYTFGYITYALGQKLKENKEDKAAATAPAIKEQSAE